MLWQTLSKALDIGRLTSRIAPDLLNFNKFYHMQLPGDLPLIEKIRNHNGNHKKAIFLG